MCVLLLTRQSLNCSLRNATKVDNGELNCTRCEETGKHDRQDADYNLEVSNQSQGWHTGWLRCRHTLVAWMCKGVVGAEDGSGTANVSLSPLIFLHASGTTVSLRLDPGTL